MICVGYSKRASCEPGAELLSLKEQNDRIRDYVKKKGWKQSCFYEDKSDSVDSDNGYQKLREAGLRKEYDVVVFCSVYRFGKNVSFARELLLNAFYKAGIHFVILDDDIDSMKMTYEELHEYFISVRMRLNSLNGRYQEKSQLACNNQISEFKVCYGYRLSEDKTEFIIDEEAASVIRKIFEMYDTGSSTYDICDFLNDSGYDSPSYHIYKLYPQRGFTGNNRWGKSVINRIKNNQIYTGCEADFGYRNVTYPEIISRELFDRVNEKIKGRTRGKKTKGKIENQLGKIYYLNDDSVLIYKSSSAARNYPYFHLENSKKEIISYQKIEYAVRRRLEEEKRKCESVLSFIESGHAVDAIAALQSEYDEMLRESAVEVEEIAKERIKLFSETESGEIDNEVYIQKDAALISKVEKLNLSLTDKINGIEDKKKLFSSDNPWIKRYISYSPDMVITRKKSKELIDKIIVGDDRSVSVMLNCNEADVFPSEWRYI